MSKPQSASLTFVTLLRRSSFVEKAALVLSTWFGCGLVPFAPGTLGTIASLPVVLWLGRHPIPHRVLGLAVLTALAVWSSGRSQQLFGKSDPSEVVIDEVAGFVLTLFLLPISWLTVICGFILFRFFDILKPFPIRRSERLKGGLGVVMDDLLAGLYAHGTLRIIMSISP